MIWKNQLVILKKKALLIFTGSESFWRDAWQEASRLPLLSTNFVTCSMENLGNSQSCAVQQAAGMKQKNDKIRKRICGPEGCC